MCSRLAVGEFAGHQCSEHLGCSNLGKVWIESTKRSFNLASCDSDVKDECVSTAINRKLNVHVSSACYQNCYHPRFTLPIEQKKTAVNHRLTTVFHFLAEWTGLYAKRKTSLISLDFLQFTLQKSATTLATTSSCVAETDSEYTRSSIREPVFGKRFPTDFTFWPEPSYR